MSHCLYPIGDPKSRDFRFCGEPTVRPGRSYCEAHHALCYVSVRDLYRAKLEREATVAEQAAKAA